MSLAILNAWDVGMFTAPIALSNPILLIAFWLCLLLGFIAQLLLLHVKLPAVRWLFPLLLFLAYLGCEIGFQMASGWDTLAWVILSYYALVLLLGAALAAGVNWLYQRSH